MTQRVLFCGAWDEGCGYPRTTALRQGLLAQGVEVFECRAPSMGRGKQKLLRQPWRLPFWALGELLRRMRFRRQVLAAVRRCRPDVVVVPYPGHHLVALVKRAVRVPVVLDLFLSAYDTAVADRGLFAKGSLAARLLLAIDKHACRNADLVLLDTKPNVMHAAQLTGVAASHFDWLPVGDPNAPSICAPFTLPNASSLRLLFFGTGVPLHGLHTLIDAVALVPEVHLTLIGGTAADRSCAQSKLQHQLTLLPEFIQREALQQQLDHAHLVAGVFGTSEKTDRVVPFKVMHALASGRPAITADSTAMRQVANAAAACFLVPAGDVVALADRLRSLALAPAQLVAAAAAAREVYDGNFAVARTGARFAAICERLVVAGGKS
ncbi:MAG: glycosyltransferase [Planctomycetota bacterium]